MTYFFVPVTGFALNLAFFGVFINDLLAFALLKPSLNGDDRNLPFSEYPSWRKSLATLFCEGVTGVVLVISRVLAIELLKGVVICSCCVTGDRVESINPAHSEGNCRLSWANSADEDRFDSIDSSACGAVPCISSIDESVAASICSLVREIG